MQRYLDSLPHDALLQLTLHLCDQIDQYIAEIPIGARERARLHGFDQRQMASVVYQVCATIDETPHLYPDAPCTKKLLHRQRSADRLHNLRAVVRLLLERIESLYLLTQGDAARGATQILRSVRETVMYGMSADDLEDRKDRMFPADHMLRNSRRRRRPGRPRKRPAPAP